MRSRSVTLRAGEAIGAPLTATRPAAIQASASRREARPARAITLAMRSPPLCPVSLSSIVPRLIAERTATDHGIFHGYGARLGARGRRAGRGPDRLRPGALRRGYCP